MRLIIYISIISVLILLSGCEEESVDNLVPEEVVLISPVNNEVCELGVSYERNTSRLLFEWDYTKNAQLYDLVVTNLDTKENYITYTDIADNSKELVLENEVSYSWQVIARNTNSNQTTTSEEWEFFFVGEPRSNQLPSPANILSPKSSEFVTATNGQISLSWIGHDPDLDELSFTVLLDQIDGKQPAKSELKNLVQSSVDIEVESGVTYYWRVMSDDGAGKSFSQVHAFTVN
ncbi:MAG: hypothetical protein RIA69_16825 [Cyclobacteriaceae bacterium]